MRPGFARIGWLALAIFQLAAFVQLWAGRCIRS